MKSIHTLTGRRTLFIQLAILAVAEILTLILYFTLRPKPYTNEDYRHRVMFHGFSEFIIFIVAQVILVIALIVVLVRSRFTKQQENQQVTVISTQATTTSAKVVEIPAAV